MIHRKFHSDEVDEDYYVPVDIVNPGDELHVTDSQPSRMRGYGGSILKFEMEDGSVESVPGPWHTNSKAFFKHTGINIGELHLTRITIWDGKDCIYQEKEPVLGAFYRGERIAQQLAVIRNRSITVRSESSSGGSEKVCYPDGRYIHPLSKRANDIVPS